MGKMVSTDEIATPEMAQIFREAWHDADAQGLRGQRVQAGLEAVAEALEFGDE